MLLKYIALSLIFLLPFIPIIWIVRKEYLKTKAQRERHQRELKEFNDLAQEALRQTRNNAPS